MPTQTGSIDMKGQKAAADIGLEVDQHFWYDSTGAHVTEVTQEEFTDPSDPSYHSGGNTLMTSTDVKIRDGVTDLAIFGSGGAVVGENASGKSRTEIGTDGMQIYQNVNGTDTEIANLGYGPGKDSGGGTSDAPYYTLGTRASGSDIGNYSVVAGYGCTASGPWSYAEGMQTEAAIGASHAEGYRTYAAGYAHAEGSWCEANGPASHAQNNYTIASSASQTALGKFNEEDNADTYAVIVGNGTGAGANRSNALTVDWGGNVCMALDTTAASGTDHDLYAAINALGWASDVIV